MLQDKKDGAQHYIYSGGATIAKHSIHFFLELTVPNAIVATLLQK